MVQPINYLAQMPQIDIAPNMLESLQAAAFLGQMRQKQQEQQQKSIQAQQAEQRLQAFRGEVENAFQQANPQVWLQLKTKYPEYEKVISPVWEQLDEKQRKAEISQYLPLQSALNAGNKEVAKKYVQRLIDANAAAGKDTKQFEDIASQIDDDINIARDTLVNTTAMVLPLKDFAEAQKKLSETKRAEAMAPITMRKETALSAEAEEKAKQAAIKSRFAESEAVIDLEKKGWDIRKIQSDMDIARQNARIAAANVQIGKTTNDLKRQELELKVEDMKQKRDEAVRLKVADASTAASQADNLLNTTELALQKAIKGRNKAGKITGYTRTIEAATGPVSTMLPTISQDVADFEELVNTLGSQITMSRIGEMKGALSDKDLETLRSSLQSLSLRQSPQQLVNNLLEVQRLTLKARKETIDKFGAPERLSQPDIPAARGAAAPAAGGFTVTAPNGQTFSFPTKQAADQFKQAAGIR